MNANPLQIACLLALIAPSQIDPIKSTVRSCAHQDDLSVSVDLTISRCAYGFLFEALVTVEEDNDPLFSYGTAEIYTPRHLADTNGFVSPICSLFSRIYADAWRGALHPCISESFQYPSDLFTWIKEFERLLVQCEKQLRGTGGTSAPVTVAAPTSPAGGSHWTSISIQADRDPVACDSAVIARPDWTLTASGFVGDQAPDFAPLETNVVYVVVANDCEKVKECLIFTDEARSKDYFHLLREAYGGANVFWAPKAVDTVPGRWAKKRDELVKFRALCADDSPPAARKMAGDKAREPGNVLRFENGSTIGPWPPSPLDPIGGGRFA